jgi:hypothetical protein
MILRHEIRICGHLADRKGQGGFSVSHSPERQDRSPEGITRRARFEASVKLLADLGLSPDALEYYRQLARQRRTLPHQVVREIAEKVAAPESIVLGKMVRNLGRPT